MIARLNDTDYEIILTPQEAKEACTWHRGFTGNLELPTFFANIQTSQGTQALAFSATNDLNVLSPKLNTNIRDGIDFRLYRPDQPTLMIDIQDIYSLRDRKRNSLTTRYRGECKLTIRIEEAV